MSDVVRRMFERVMTLELVAMYCYKGRNKSKFNFESLMLRSVMIGKILIISFLNVTVRLCVASKYTE